MKTAHWGCPLGSGKPGGDYTVAWVTGVLFFKWYFYVTRLYYHLEKEMATHSSVLAWRIPGTGEPGGLPSMGSHRVGHDWSDLAAAAAVNRYRFYCWADGNALAIDSGAGCTKLWIYWNSLTCTLKSGGLHYVKYVNSNNKKEKNY